MNWEISESNTKKHMTRINRQVSAKTQGQLVNLMQLNTPGMYQGASQPLLIQPKKRIIPPTKTKEDKGSAGMSHQPNLAKNVNPGSDQGKIFRSGAKGSAPE